MRVLCAARVCVGVVFGGGGAVVADLGHALQVRFVPFFVLDACVGGLFGTKFGLFGGG